MFGAIRQLFGRLSLSSKMLFVVGVAFAIIAAPLVVYDVASKHQQIEDMAERHANAALDMLEAMHGQPMIHHGSLDETNKATDTLDDSLEQFSEINENVNLWLVMGPKVLAYQESNNNDVVRRPLDSIDTAVIQTGQASMVLNTDDVLRVSRPAVLGRGHAGEGRCVRCHSELMKMEAGEVLGAYSAAVDLGVEFAAWRQEIAKSIAAVALFEVLILALVFYLLRVTALRPLSQLTVATRRLAAGNTETEIDWTERTDEIGLMARSLNVFKTNLIEKKEIEAEQEVTLDLLETQKHRLETALDKERELNGLQRHFVSMVSHEFRTPLAIIDGNAQRIIKRKDEIGPERLQNGIQKIRGSVVRLINLMESVLSASRLEAGTVKFQPEPIDLNDVIDEVCANHREVDSNHEIITDRAELPEQLCVDATLMRQVLSNLVSNAIKYTPSGTRVWVHGVMTNDEEVTISVRDEGPGIPPDELSKLFDRFFRGSSSTGIIGTGIGLHMAQAFVDLHGGRIDVASKEGEGTTFTVYLPKTGSMISHPKQALESADAAA